jgi:hypothetical protein
MSRPIKEREYNLHEPLDIVRFIARHPFSLSYENVAVMHDGCLLCPTCLKENYKMILDSTKNEDHTSWEVIAVECENMFEGEYCAHCNELIGEPLEDN